MKKTFLLLLTLLFTHTFFAQNQLNQFENMDDVNTIVVTKKMFDLMGKVQVHNADKQTQDYLNLTKKLDNLRVFTTQNKTIESQMKVAANDYVKSTQLVETKKINDGGNIATIYTNTGATNTQLKELFMLVTSSSEESVLMDLKGDFNPNEISLLIDKMQIPGGNYLKQITSK